MTESFAFREYLIAQALGGLLAAGESGPGVVAQAIALADETLAALASDRPKPRRGYADAEERRKRPKDRRKA